MTIPWDGLPHLQNFFQLDFLFSGLQVSSTEIFLARLSCFLLIFGAGLIWVGFKILMKVLDCVQTFWAVSGLCQSLSSCFCSWQSRCHRIAWARKVDQLHLACGRSVRTGGDRGPCPGALEVRRGSSTPTYQRLQVPLGSFCPRFQNLFSPSGKHRHTLHERAGCPVCIIKFFHENENSASQQLLGVDLYQVSHLQLFSLQDGQFPARPSPSSSIDWVRFWVLVRQ